MHPSKSDIGAYIKPVAGLVPLDNSAGARTSSAIDVSNYGSLTLAAMVGATSGTPDSFTATYSLTSCDTEGGSYAAVSDSSFVISAGSTLGEVDVDLSKLSSGHKYIKVVEVIAFVNGTSPKIEGAALVILGGGRTLPI